jgi:pimeloyl-ACP methyl ester carboxylesterase
LFAPLAKLIDWSAFQFAASLISSSDGQNSRLEEALKFLKGPDFIPVESQPARVEFDGGNAGLHFRFPTPRPCKFEKNNVVYGRLYRCGGRWQERPVLILLHGGMDYPDHVLRFPRVARQCNRAGFNAATLVGPYHFQRRVSGAGGEVLTGEDYLWLAEFMAQGVAEIRALTGWLLGQGCPAVALAGISLGGWLAGLTACYDARLAAAVLIVPAVRMAQFSSLAERILSRRVREAIRGQRGAYEALDTTPLNLALSRPAISRDNLLLIEAIHDFCAGGKLFEELCQSWGQPEIWRMRHGHISLWSMPGLTGRVLRWLAPRLDAPAV